MCNFSSNSGRVKVGADFRLLAAAANLACLAVLGLYSTPTNALGMTSPRLLCYGTEREDSQR